MWFFTTEGAYSAVLETKLKPYVGMICVRAREPGAIDRLRETYMPGLSEQSITPSNVSADYRYRGWATLEDYKAGQNAIADAITYSNFKSEVARKRGQGPYEKACHDVWGVLAKMQPGGPYGWGGKGYPPIPKGEPKLKPYAPATPKKTRTKKSKLQASFEPGGTQPCADCGHELADGEGVWLGGRWLCASLSECNARAAASVE